jgi:outer membrane receptor protein involved in Fe transport
MNPRNFLRHRCRSLFRSLLFTGAFLLPLPLQAQSAGRITGVVKDAATRAPLKAVTVMLRDPADSTVRSLGDLTDEKGTFSVEQVVIGRKYLLDVRYVGYEQHSEDITLTAEKPDLNLGEILLRQESVEGKEIKVEGERNAVTVMVDKTVYAVENNPSYTATNVSELLGQIPSVQVDQDGKVSLRGNDNVTIMMNDRPLTMPAEQRNKFLQSLPASTVKDIEIRTNPGAQFDAKNQGGIINIVTRRSMSDMIGGNVNAGADSREALNGGAGLYYNGSTVNASLSGGVYHGPGHGSSSSLRLNYLDSAERRNEATGSSESVSNSQYGYGQVDYNFTGTDLASFSFNLNHWSSSYSSIGDHTFFDPNHLVTGTFYDTSAPNANNRNGGGYNNASFLLKHTFSQDHKLSLDVSYNSYGYSGGNIYSSTYFLADGQLDSIRSSSRTSTYDQSNATLITSLDYENPLSKAIKLSLGGKNEINSLDNNTSVSNLDRSSGEFMLDTLQTNHYLPRNAIYALYGNIAYMLFEGVNVQGGVRVERANVSAKYATGREIISRDYTNFFPSGSIAYNITEQQSLTLSYRRSIALPDVDALNPVKVKWSDLSFYSGNPDLEPEFTQSLELNYNTYWGMGNMVTVSPYYSTTSGNIESGQTLVNGATYSSYANFNGSYSIGSELSVAMRPLGWLNFRVAGDIYRKVNRGSGIPGDAYSAAGGYSGNGSLNADLLEGLTFSTNFFFNRPATVGENRQSGYMYWSCALRQKLLDNKLTVSLRLNDPLNLQKWQNIYSTPEFYTESTSRWSSRFIGLNISYNFGTTPRMETHRQAKSETKGSGGTGGNSGGSGQGGQ